MPAVVATGHLVGHGAGVHVERVLQVLGPVEYIVLAVAVLLVGSGFVWRAVRAFKGPPASGSLCAGGLDWPHDLRLASSISVPFIGLPSLLALDTKLPGGRCLTHIGREGALARRRAGTAPKSPAEGHLTGGRAAICSGLMP